MRPVLGILTAAMWVLLMATPVKADAALIDIGRLVAKNAMVCADFIQSKSLRVLKRPLISKGNLKFVVEKGILWQVWVPFPTQVLVKKDALIRWNDDGQPRRLSLESNPVFSALSRVFLAVFRGEISALRDVFEIQSEVGPSNWRMSLTPRDDRLGSVIAQISASGGRFLHELHIQEGNGDRTLIKFNNVNAEPCRLSTHEKRYFAE